MKTLTFCMMFLVVLTPVTFAQTSIVPHMETEHDRLAQASDKDRAPTDKKGNVDQAATKAGACINPKTGQPDQIVQCLVSPCGAFKPPSPFATCVDNYCGGCHAILCGILLGDVSSGFKAPDKY